MGFNLYNLGVIRECWITNGKLEFKSPITGKVTSCPIGLDVEVKPQTNIFYSKTVAFLLEDETSRYIGRYDGKVSIYRLSDSMLTGLKSWIPPVQPTTLLCGYYRPKGVVYEVYMDCTDRKTLYIGFHNIELALSSLVPAFDISYAVKACENIYDTNKLQIFAEGGVRCETESWTVQDELWQRNCRVFL